MLKCYYCKLPVLGHKATFRRLDPGGDSFVIAHKACAMARHHPGTKNKNVSCHACKKPLSLADLVFPVESGEVGKYFLYCATCHVGMNEPF